MAMLHVVLGRPLVFRFRSRASDHTFFADSTTGHKTFNIEATQAGERGFSSQSDEYELEKHGVSAKAVRCGSDLGRVTPREMLGLFFALLPRHFDNTNRTAEAEPDYLFARYLFPMNRQLYLTQNELEC